MFVTFGFQISETWGVDEKVLMHSRCANWNSLCSTLYGKQQQRGTTVIRERIRTETFV